MAKQPRDDESSSAAQAHSPDSTEYEDYKAKGALLLDLREFGHAIACFERALALRPDLAEAHFNLGAAYHGQRVLDQAAACYQHALVLQPDLMQALCNAGAALRELGRLEDSVACLQRAIAIRPDFADAHYNLGAVMLEQGKPDHAADCFRAAIANNPDHAEALFHLGLLLRRRLELEESAACLQRAIAVDPGIAEAHFGLGSVLLEQGKPEQAVVHLQSALSLRPEFAEAHADLGLALFALGKFDEANASCHKALQLRSDLAAAHVNLGLVLEHGFGRLEEAVGCFQEALRLNPDDANAHASLGTAYQEDGRLDEASACFERALRVAPDNANANMARALHGLLRGQFEDGWRRYEWRLAQALDVHRRFKFPRWDGSSLAQRRLLIYAEQGIGDQIMFASCLPDVLAQTAACVIECTAKLGPLFQRSFPQATVHAGTEDDPAAWLAESGPVDVSLPIGSLPLFFRRTAADFPRHQGYLRADPAKVHHWRNRLGKLGQGSKVGISWRGGMPMSGRTRRSLDLDRLLPILRVPNTTFVDLQYTDCSRETALLEEQHGIKIRRWRDAIEDYDETAALVCALDLTISVCTALVHLGGALGRPVWVMAPYCPEWRYGFWGDAMPWYPSVTIFRQAECGRWEGPIENVAGRLSALASSRK